MDDRYGIGVRVRYWRRVRGRSQQQVAQDVGRSRPGVALIEDRGTDSLTFLVDLCRSLRITIHQFFAAPVPGADLSPERLAELDDALGIDTENAPSVLIARTLGQKVHEDPVLVLIQGGGWQLMERRAALNYLGKATLIALGGGVPVVLNADDANAVTHALRTQVVNQQAVEAYRGLLTAIRRAEDQLGSQPALLKATEIHLNTVQGWLGSSQPASIRPHLTRLAAEFGQFAGWLAFDGGNPARAVELYRAALERAQALGDHPLTAYILGRMAHTEVGTVQAVRHAREAVQAARLTDVWQVRSNANDQLARALAHAGQAKPTMAAIGQAVDDLARAGRSEAPPYLYWFDEAALFQSRGYAMVYIGRHREAEAALRMAVDAMPVQYARDRASTLVTLAECRIAAKDIPGTCDTGTQAANLLRSTFSARLTRRLRTLHRRLVSHGSSPSIAAFGDRLQGL
jgi:tetratricopeptide (TPR) repeat protein/DNA-binding XRE family transcriptional regulator